MPYMFSEIKMYELSLKLHLILLLALVAQLTL